MSRLQALQSKLAALTGASAPPPILPPASPIPATPQAPAYPVRVQTDPTVGPMMPLDTITYIQAAFWDNSDKSKEYTDAKGKTKKRRAPPFKLTIEAWTTPRLIRTKNGMQFTRNLQLRYAGPFRSAILDVNRGKQISEAFYQEILPIVGAAEETDMFGIIFDRGVVPGSHEGKGWTYFDHQFVHVRFSSDGVPTVDLHVNGDTITLNQFSDRFANSDGVKFTTLWTRPQ